MEQTERFKVVEQSTISAQAVTRLLESMIGRSPGLKLLSLRTLPVVPLLKHGEAEQDAATKRATDTTTIVYEETNLYRHEIEVKVAGSYASLVEYLAHLEVDAPTLGWSRLSLDAVAYPESVMTLSVQTISLDAAWLEL